MIVSSRQASVALLLLLVIDQNYYITNAFQSPSCAISSSRSTRGSFVTDKSCRTVTALWNNDDDDINEEEQMDSITMNLSRKDNNVVHRRRPLRNLLSKFSGGKRKRTSLLKSIVMPFVITATATLTSNPQVSNAANNNVPVMESSSKVEGTTMTEEGPTSVEEQDVATVRGGDNVEVAEENEVESSSSLSTTTDNQGNGVKKVSTVVVVAGGSGYAVKILRDKSVVDEEERKKQLDLLFGENSNEESSDSPPPLEVVAVDKVNKQEEEEEVVVVPVANDEEQEETTDIVEAQEVNEISDTDNEKEEEEEVEEVVSTDDDKSEIKDNDASDVIEATKENAEEEIGEKVKQKKEDSQQGFLGGLQKKFIRQLDGGNAGEVKESVKKTISQPKSARDEKALAAKYAAIESLEERAYQILVDLDMI